MKKVMARPVAALMAAAMLLTLLTGCKKDGPDDNYGNGSDGTQNLSGDPSEFVYIAETVPIPDGIGIPYNLTAFDDKLYFTTYAIDHGGEDDYFAYTETFDIYSMNTDGTGIARLADYAHYKSRPAGVYGGSSIAGMHIDDDGNLWVLEYWRFFGHDFPPGVDNPEEAWKYEVVRDSGHILRKLSRTGAELFTVDVSNLPGLGEFDDYYTSQVIIDNFGNIYLNVGYRDRNGMEIYVLDGTGAMLFQLHAEEWFWYCTFIRMPDGSIAFPIESYDAAGVFSRKLQTIDVMKEAFGETIDMPAIEAELYQGYGDYDIFMRNRDGIYGFIAGEENAMMLLRWTDSYISEENISTGSGGITMIPGGHIVCISKTVDWVELKEFYKFLILKKTPRSELPEKVTLTLAVFAPIYDTYGSFISNTVMEFNKTNLYYHIEVLNYSKYNTESDWYAGLTMLITDITSGKIPDIMEVQHLPYREYAEKGLFADIYPLIDSDPGLSRSDFMQGALRAAEVDGGLYQIFPDFSISAIFGHPSVVGTDPGWTMDEFLALGETYPDADLPFGGGYTKISFLQALVTFSLDDYIDWGAGTARFDSPDFIRVLEAANTFPDVFDVDGWDDSCNYYHAVPAGRQLIMVTSIYNFIGLAWDKPLFGGEVTFKHYPGESISGNPILVRSGLAISEACENKDGAWAFVRLYLDNDWLRANNRLRSGELPTNHDRFMDAVQDALGNDYRESETDMPVTPVPITQADIDQLIALIDSASGVYGLSEGTGVDETIWNIISESALDYFGGAITAEDAARVIQSRVSILVSERS